MVKTQLRGGLPGKRRKAQICRHLNLVFAKRDFRATNCRGRGSFAVGEERGGGEKFLSSIRTGLSSKRRKTSIATFEE